MAKKQTTLYSIYGARPSKDGKRVNLSIVTGEGDARRWGTISIKLDNNSKVHVEMNDNDVLVKVPLLVDSKDEDQDDDLPF